MDGAATMMIDKEANNGITPNKPLEGSWWTEFHWAVHL